MVSERRPEGSRSAEIRYVRSCRSTFLNQLQGGYLFSSLRFLLSLSLFLFRSLYLPALSSIGSLPEGIHCGFRPVNSGLVQLLFNLPLHRTKLDIFDYTVLLGGYTGCPESTGVGGFAPLSSKSLRSLIDAVITEFFNNFLYLSLSLSWEITLIFNESNNYTAESTQYKIFF